MSAPWWRNAPLSKALFYSTLGSSLYITMTASRADHGLTAHAVLHELQLHRLITSHIPFLSLAETVLGLAVLYRLRQIERMFGMNKFAAFMTFLVSFTSSLELGWLSYGVRSSFQFATGPYPVIGALLMLEHGLIPITRQTAFSLFRIPFSDKSVNLLVAFPLIFSQGLRSILPTAFGALTAWLYLSDIGHIQSLRIPGPIARMFSAVLPLLQESHHVTRQQQQPPHQQQHQQHHAPAPPSEENIETLMALGFDRTAVTNALLISGNNPQVAAERLLSMS